MGYKVKVEYMSLAELVKHCEKSGCGNCPFSGSAPNTCMCGIIGTVIESNQQYDLLNTDLEIPDDESEIEKVEFEAIKCPHCGYSEYRLIDTAYNYDTMEFRHTIICEHCQQMMVYEDLKKEEK